jgi:hypothetical protein
MSDLSDEDDDAEDDMEDEDMMQHHHYHSGMEDDEVSLTNIKRLWRVQDVYVEVELTMLSMLSHQDEMDEDDEREMISDDEVEEIIDDDDEDDTDEDEEGGNRELTWQLEDIADQNEPILRLHTELDDDDQDHHHHHHRRHADLFEEASIFIDMESFSPRPYRN